ncbi:MAG: hypothetical protein LUE29_08610 [Lachnospiraceae bacterium]|nr:hypothetical protein [Lachnospiraceae bacterium]
MNGKKEPETIRQKTVAPLKTGAKIQAEKAVCCFDYYLKDSRGKWLPRLYLCEHRTLADIFLEAALFSPKKNVLCISRAEWESSPEEARKALRKFRKIFREPYRVSPGFIRRLFDARREGKSILLPVTEDARGMDREPFLDEKAVAQICRKLEMQVCTVTFREEREEEGDHFFLDVRPLFTPEELVKMSGAETGAAVLELFSEKTNSQKTGEFRGRKDEDFQERKRLMLREFLKSELNLEIPVEICDCHTFGISDETGKADAPAADGRLRVDMTGITLETAGSRYHRSPGALKSLAVYPGKMTETGDRGTMLIYPYYDRTFYLFTEQKEEAISIQAATEEMYRIVSSQ